MSNYFARQHAGYINELNRSMAALLGIATGMLADRHLADAEIHFLADWLTANDAIANEWPGDVVAGKVRAILADGVITEEERGHLVSVLQQLIGGRLEQINELPRVCELMLDTPAAVRFEEALFCLTGDFVFAPRHACADVIAQRGGIVKTTISQKLDYLVVGGLGSPEWKQGSFGTKITAAMKLKQAGAKLQIIHEDTWAQAL